MKIGVIGASGRMGQAVIAELSAQDETCAAALVSAQSSVLGQPAQGGLLYSTVAEVTSECVDVLIDFSLPEALMTNLAVAKRIQRPIVVCTTGLSAAQEQLLQTTAQQVPVLHAANTSIGVCLLQQLVQLASGVMADADIEILDIHHSAKRDGPSGTARLLAEAAAQGRGYQLQDTDAVVRGDGLRQPGSIGYAVMRAADVVGEHNVMLAQAGERVELAHRVTDRAIFARGAIRAARWLAKQPAGRYQMRDVLELSKLFHKLSDEI
ncbi:4-hydroxy-tetrahydrodipicolinate reductase [Pseudidiomarina sediminum]|uniref:4-hydroxy-tetrahydrodipicolinate reductase n=1 Tax=Pseudidiomarina sediminum TaxID=431675 RepID=UPI001C94AD37|nr:4-hydroxy-tetrahydrodipicolinate reductase [Pseudidiomarina sediminum]MBY6063461.1 4-hydroxy-tetrahydrodipicolinate reductase [Pseudidiomarina sediminum]